MFGLKVCEQSRILIEPLRTPLRGPQSRPAADHPTQRLLNRKIADNRGQHGGGDVERKRDPSRRPRKHQEDLLPNVETVRYQPEPNQRPEIECPAKRRSWRRKQPSQ